MTGYANREYNNAPKIIPSYYAPECKVGASKVGVEPVVEEVPENGWEDFLFFGLNCLNNLLV